MHPAVAWLRGIVRRPGFDVTRYPPPPPAPPTPPPEPPPSHRAEDDFVARMREQGVTVLIDGGANTGQFASAMRASGWTERIISFEPAPDEFSALAENAAG